MTTKAKKLTDYTVDLLDHRHHLASYWFGVKWCPAVRRDGDGFSIRIGRRTATGHSFDYFKLDGDGVVQASPRGYAREYNRRVRISDVAAVAECMTEPDPSAVRFRI